MKDEVRTIFRVDRDLYNALKVLADKDTRSMNYMITQAVKQFVTNPPTTSKGNK